nr:PREDICTED: zinc finger MYM-type protein 5-like [Latimeria chalumnae]|eukprot:XP_005998628.1 PREDICTED: zinc finger MYM-type protein 5-like [Latimeria chalumnae]
MRRFEPGAQKHKKKKLQEEAAKGQQGAIEKLIKRSETLEFMDDESVIETEAVNDGLPTTDEMHHVMSTSTATSSTSTVSSCTSASATSYAAGQSYEDEDLLSSNNPETDPHLVLQPSIDLHDPGTWPSVIDSKLRSKIVDYGPYQVKDITCPEDEKKRHFTASYYLRKLPNGETISHNWLVYSQTKDAV